MRHDTRLSRMLHILIHMDRHEGAAVTSAAIATMLCTNAVVVRRTMAGLRDQGYVRSEKGHGGGWVLARSLQDITLLDIHRALGAPELFSIGLAGDNPHCVVEQAVNASLAEAMGEAEAILLARFGTITLAELSADSLNRWAKVSNRSSAMEHF
jgi:DNA-binding IscR family transcriptional regulator